MNLSNTQKELLDLIYNVILNQETTEKERKAFKNAKYRIESGKKFDSEISELLKELMYIPNSRPVDEFTEEARKRMYVGPGTSGTTHGFSNYQTK